MKDVITWTQEYLFIMLKTAAVIFIDSQSSNRQSKSHTSKNAQEDTNIHRHELIGDGLMKNGYESMFQISFENHECFIRQVHPNCYYCNVQKPSNV